MSHGLVTAQPRVLLVGANAAWERAVAEASGRAGMVMDVVHSLRGAIRHLLPAERHYSSVLAPRALGRLSLYTMAALLDEGSHPGANLILLGAEDGAGLTEAWVKQPDMVHLTAILRDTATTASPERWGQAHTPPPIASLRAGTLRMRYQPIANATTLAPIGLEALARLHHPTLGILHPRAFVPAASETTRGHRLAMVTASRALYCQKRLPPALGLFVSVNLPLDTMLMPEALVRARRRCDTTRTDPNCFVIELLETPEPPDYRRLAASMAAWREAGFRIAIDDAGPALPHWRAMLSLPADFLKLDGLMVADPCQHEYTAEIVSAAKACGLQIIAEGVETRTTLDRVRRLGVDAIQGFLICRPLPSLAVPVWLEEQGRGVDASG